AGPAVPRRPAPAWRGQQWLTGRGRAVRVQQWTVMAGPRGSQAGTKGRRPTKARMGVTAGERANSLIRSSGQGRGRTADLPLFRMWDHRAGPAMVVYLPAQRPAVHADGRRGTGRFGTKNGTAVWPRPAGGVAGLIFPDQVS